MLSSSIRMSSILFNASAQAAAAISANCSSAVPYVVICVFCRVCLPEFGLQTNCTFLNLKKFPLLLLLDIAGHILVFDRWSLHMWRICMLPFFSACLLDRVLCMIHIISAPTC